MQTPGARFGAFEILEPIGVGGMGEVYRARDTRLDRIVALKLIRTSNAPSRDRVERFTREARAVSRLNHPHICALYDIGEHEGESFLVMEYVAGETLARRLERGRLGADEVLLYGEQVAEALAAAHRSGVIHRDLKPSNVMLTRGGVKLLDFGVAKLRDMEPTGEAATMSLTEDGLILGSLPYMAPEQLEGKPVDARADLFALGAVLYEMATGRPPFHADSRASLIVAILTEPPAPATADAPITPPLLAHTIRRCLAKAPEDRWQSAADLAATLRWIADPAGRGENNAAAPARVPRFLQVSGLVAATAAATVLAAFVAFRSPPPPAAVYTPVTFRHGVVSTARFSPDGQNVVYSASWEGSPYDVFLGHEGTPDARPLGMKDGRILSVSTVGDLAVVFGRQNVTQPYGLSTLARLPLAGGTRRDLLDGVTEADWIPGTDTLAIVRVRQADGISVVEFPMGTKVHEALAVWSLRVSPDGGRVAFFEGPRRFGTAPEAMVSVVDRSGKKSTLSAGWAGLGLAWNPAGSEIWFTASRGARPPALEAVSLSGRPRSILAAPDWLVLQDIFRDGRVLLSRNSIRLAISCRARGDATERDLTWSGGSMVSDLSPDGRMVIFNETLYGAASGIPTVFRRDLDGSAAVALGSGTARSLSPDGKWVLALVRGQLVLVPTGAGSPKTISTANLKAVANAAWLPGGTRIVFTGVDSSNAASSRIYIQDLNDDAPRQITPEGVSLADRAPSPDGIHVLARAGARWLLYPIVGGDPQPVPSIAADDEPLRWTPGGESLYVVSRKEPLAQRRDIVRVNLANGARTRLTTLVPPDLVGVDNVGPIAITPDGQAYCYTYLRRLGALFIVAGVR